MSLYSFLVVELIMSKYCTVYCMEDKNGAKNMLLKFKYTMPPVSVSFADTYVHREGGGRAQGRL